MIAYRHPNHLYLKNIVEKPYLLPKIQFFLDFFEGEGSHYNSNFLASIFWEFKKHLAEILLKFFFSSKHFITQAFIVVIFYWKYLNLI